MLGNEDSTVYIPGKLVVNKDAYLAIKQGHIAYLRGHDWNNSNAKNFGYIRYRSVDTCSFDNKVDGGDKTFVPSGYSYETSDIHSKMIRLKPHMLV